MGDAWTIARLTKIELTAFFEAPDRRTGRGRDPAKGALCGETPAGGLRRARAPTSSDRPILAPPADPADLAEERTTGDRDASPNRTTPLKESSRTGARSRGTCLDFLLHIGATLRGQNTRKRMAIA